MVAIRIIEFNWKTVPRADGKEESDDDIMQRNIHFERHASYSSSFLEKYFLVRLLGETTLHTNPIVPQQLIPVFTGVAEKYVSLTVTLLLLSTGRRRNGKVGRWLRCFSLFPFR